MSVAANEQLEAYKEKCKKEAETLVKDVFPQQVLALNQLLDSAQFSMAGLAKVDVTLNIPVPETVVFNCDSGELQTKKRKHDCIDNNDQNIPGSKIVLLPSGPVPCNHCIVELVDVVKPKIREIIDHCNQVKMWIAYLIPRIEDGNNFGVGIQEDVLAESRQVESEAATFLDQISRYFLTRAKIVSKVAKYPHVTDYRRSVTELDEKQGLTLRLVLCELRNQYGSLHDMIIKNLDKIKKPRSMNTENMY
nr:proteasome activator complex subunit 3 [Arenicola marina]